MTSDTRKHGDRLANVLSAAIEHCVGNPDLETPPWFDDALSALAAWHAHRDDVEHKTNPEDQTVTAGSNVTVKLPDIDTETGEIR